MRNYETGNWGFALIWGYRASVFPRALLLALPNAGLTFTMAYLMPLYMDLGRDSDDNSIAVQERVKYAFSIWTGFTSVLFFLLFFRSNVAYSRWWEGGTLLQQTRGEWFNAYSSLIAFSSTDPVKGQDLEQFHHKLARLMSLLMCSALQQVSPCRSRGFEIIDIEGFDPSSIEFFSSANDRCEVVLQWIQRSIMLNLNNGILIAPPPILSRAFQEFARGMVNLNNARKIADFPFPFPYAQTSIVMLLIHWVTCPVLCSFLLDPYLAALTSFVAVFFLWCVNFIALKLESPFGDGDNDLPMQQMQNDWNKSVGTLLTWKAQHPPDFTFDEQVHRNLEMAMSDGSQSRKWILELPMKSRPSIPSSEGSEHADEDEVMAMKPQKLSTNTATTATGSTAPSSSPPSRCSSPQPRKQTSQQSRTSGSTVPSRRMSRDLDHERSRSPPRSGSPSRTNSKDPGSQDTTPVRSPRSPSKDSPRKEAASRDSSPETYCEHRDSSVIDTEHLQMDFSDCTFGEQGDHLDVWDGSHGGTHARGISGGSAATRFGGGDIQRVMDLPRRNMIAIARARNSNNQPAEYEEEVRMDVDREEARSTATPWSCRPTKGRGRSSFVMEEMQGHPRPQTVGARGRATTSQDDHTSL